MSARSRKLAELNDRLRQTGQGGRIVITRGIRERGETFVARVLERVRTFDAFTKENDPYGEHDFGNFELDGETIYFKVDYYNKTLDGGSENPADPDQTTRVLTIMLAEEY